MEAGLIISLAVLALIDSASIGTLGIPLWLLATPSRPRVSRLVQYLAAVASFYCVLGCVLYLGGQPLLDRFNGATESAGAQWALVVVGSLLIVIGLTCEPWTAAGKERKRERIAARRTVRGPGRLARWREQVTSGSASAGSVMAVGVAAAAVESASMLPYLAAIALLISSGLGTVASLTALVTYCAVMVAPALVLLALRIALHERTLPLIQRLDGWMTRNSGEATSWIYVILGLLFLRQGSEVLPWVTMK